MNHSEFIADKEKFYGKIPTFGKIKGFFIKLFGKKIKASERMIDGEDFETEVTLYHLWGKIYITEVREIR